MTDTLAHPGFADPVLDSQACFRAILDALARPGTVHTLGAPAEPPPPLDRATAAVLLTLVDLDTPVWLDPQAQAAAGWIAFHCGAPLAEARKAAFGVALAPGSLSLSAFGAGTDDGPEESATLVLQVAGFGTGPALRLSGPGLAAPVVLRVEGLAAGFVAEWRANHALFPRGVDVVLCAGNRVAAFPRTLRIEEV